jgi:L-cystine transport system permease protein
MDFSPLFMLEVLGVALKAVPRSLAMALSAMGIGIVLGLPLALLRFFNVRFCAGVLKWLVRIFKGVPVVLMFLIFYVLLAVRLGLPGEIVVVAALSVLSGVGMSEIFRGCLESIDRSQYDAAYSVGHTGQAMFFRIILPQLIPAAVPMAANVCIGMIKAVAVASLIGVMDILNSALLEATINYRYLEAYFAAGIVYWVLCITVEKIFGFIERGFNYRASSAA